MRIYRENNGNATLKNKIAVASQQHVLKEVRQSPNFRLWKQHEAADRLTKRPNWNCRSISHKTGVMNWTPSMASISRCKHRRSRFVPPSFLKRTGGFSLLNTDLIHRLTQLRTQYDSKSGRSEADLRAKGGQNIHQIYMSQSLCKVLKVLENA